MLTKKLHYDLPPEKIAQFPSKQRDESRLLMHVRSTGETTHHRFRDLPDLLCAGTRIFRNDVAVLKARIHGERPTGGLVECLLVRPVETKKADNVWRCLLKPGLKTHKGGSFSNKGEYSATVSRKLPSGEYLVHFDLSKDPDVPALAERLGAMPLPPYVKRAAEEEDFARYQTVYASSSKRTAIAAPTAGLHFTPELLNALQAKGHPMYDLTLSVGPGTFRPIETELVEEHQMHTESYELSPEVKFALRKEGSPRLAVGTTTTRAIEHHLSLGEDCQPRDSTMGEADLFIAPPYPPFLGVDCMLTNFHLPASTLLCLVAAFLSPGKEDGLDLLKQLYAEALARDYRFYSYGDAMLIR
jgi:S-adenosylmethionine:tRNA ribosyltransferase-isomerase